MRRVFFFFFFLKFNSKALGACPAQGGSGKLGDNISQRQLVQDVRSQMDWSLAFGYQDTSQVISCATMGCTKELFS